MRTSRVSSAPRSIVRIAAIVVAVAAGAAARPAHAQTLCADGSIVWAPTTCPSAPTPTPVPNATATPTPTPTKTVVAAVPSAPTLVSMTQVTGSTYVNLAWAAPASNGGSAITAYLATQYVNGAKGQVYTYSGSTLKAQAPCGGSRSTSTCGYTISAANAVGASAPAT